MAFVPWKDRVTSTPHRYKLTQVSADTYDLTAVPGAIGEAGTPVNAENLNKLIQRDGDDIKDTVTTFTEASSRANIGTGEKTSTIFGKIKKWFTDLKPHAFTTPSATQSTSADTVPSSKLLRESSFARVYREATELSGITYPVSITDLLNKIIADNLLNCVFVIGMNDATETKVTGLPTLGGDPQTFGTLTIIVGSRALRMRVEYSKEIGNGTALIWLGSLVRSGNTVTSVNWKQIIDDSSAQTISGVKTYTASPIVPTTPSGPSAAVSKTYADSVGFARVYREATEISGITYPVAIGVLCKELSDRNLLNTYMVIGCSAATEDKITGLPTIGETPQTYGQLIIRVPGTSALRMDIEYTKHTGTGEADIKWIGDLNRGTTPWTVNWKMIIDDGSAQNITGIKTFATGATPLITDAPTTDLMAVNKTYADSVGFARVYREATEISGITYPVAIGVLCKELSDRNLLNTYMVIGCSAATEDKVTGLPTIGETPQTYGQLIIRVPGTSALRMDIEYTKHTGTGTGDIKWIGDLNRGTTPWTVNWKMVIDDSSAQTITGIKTFATGATPLITDAPTTDLMAVNKAYVDGLSTPYDKVIRTQAEFNELIASPNWLGATSVALVGQFTLSTANNSGIKIPATVKQIHGFNGAKITITNFVFNLDTAKGGLWYDTAPTTLDYSIRDLEVDCTGTGNGYGFYNCTNLTNCTGTGTGTGNLGYGFGFHSCTNLTNCTGTGTGTGRYGCGFYYCTNLTNCKGTGIGTGATGYGFFNCKYASNCKDGGSSTNMWGGYANTNIDVDTCCKTPVEADLTKLNT